MEYVASWAAQFVRQPKPDRLADIFQAAGLSVERVHGGITLPETVVVGRVLSVAPHPNADRLKLARIDVGRGQPLAIVCGAPNIAKGQRVCVALPGTTLPGGVTIQVSKIRGQESHGMVCAADELGLGDDHAGILVLPATAVVGAPAADALPSGETVLTLSIPPNRGDAMSQYGLAREVAAAEKTTLAQPPKPLPSTGTKPLTVRIAAKECPLYAAVRLTGVHVGPSPHWLQQHLRLAGLRSVNNVVDVTNVVMLELGQPLHAFDADVVGAALTVRAAKPNERLTTLDGVERTLHSSMLVVADDRRPLALAGVMGGKESAVTDATTNVVLEAAVFGARTVDAAARALRLASDSSQRFSRGVDPSITQPALARAVELLKQVAGAKRDGAATVAGKLPKPATVRTPLAALNGLLGASLSSKAAAALLRRLGFGVTGASTLSVTVPPHRHDITIPEDVAEEVARLAGYGAIVKTLPARPARPVALSPYRQFQRDLAQQLARLGGHEHIGYAYVPSEDVTEPNRAVRIMNPLSREQEFLRTSLLPALFRKAGENARQERMFRLFEFGREYRRTSSGYEERDVCAVLCHEPMPLRTLKGVLEAILHRFGVAMFSYDTDADAVTLSVGLRRIGELRFPTEGERQRAKLKDACAAATLDLKELFAALPAAPRPRFVPAPVYPPVKRDLALWVEAGVSFRSVLHCLEKYREHLASHELFDVFEKDGKRSLAFHLTFRSPDRTLSSAEVDMELERIKAELQRVCRATLRS